MAVRERRWERLDPGARREQILGAARETFAALGYEDASLTAISRAAGVSRALVTHYFGGKRELFLEAQRSMLERGEDLVRTDLGLPLEKTVRHNVAAWLDFVEGNPDIALRFNAFTLADRDAEAARLAEETRDRIVDTILVNHIGTTEVPPQARLVVRAFTGLAQAAIAEWLLHERATRDEVELLMVRGLLALVREVVPALVEQADGPAG